MREGLVRRKELERETLLAELHAFARGLTLPGLGETIRLLESDRFEEVTHAQIHAVAEYEPIEIEGARFFHRAFSSGKEAAASLGFAKCLGREVVHGDLVRLRAALLGRDLGL